jgi:glutathione S-transferase
MSSPILKFTYFRGHGLGEQIRWLLAASTSTKDFQQAALTSNAQFKALQDDDSLLFRQLPLLQIDGLYLCQSQAIARYVAKRNKLMGNSPTEEVLIDQICEAVKDARLPIVRWAFAPDKKSHIDTFVMPAIEKFFPLLNAMVERSSSGWTASTQSYTVADIFVAETVHEYALMLPDNDFLAKYTALSDLRDKIVSIPSIHEYLSSDRRFPFPAEGELCDAYVKNVNEVLGR